MRLTETITWRDAADLPDADTTVLIEIHPDEDYSEPVFLGFHDGDTWRDVHGEPLQVVAWAEPPVGTRSAGAPAAVKDGLTDTVKDSASRVLDGVQPSDGTSTKGVTDAG